MDGEGAASMAFHMVLRSHVKKKLRSNASLPEDIIFNILLLLPAEILYTVMRYVCRRWHMIIHDPRFVSAHLLRSTTSTFLVKIFPLYSINETIFQLMHVRERDVEFLDYKFGFADQILSSCNGLMLAYDKRSQSTDALYYILNPVTNKMLTLPRLTFGGKCGYLTLAASSNLYKVVVVLREMNVRSRCVLASARTTRLAIFTVGVDKEWRFISVAHLDDDVVMNLISKPIVSTGFLYWDRSASRGSLLTLNVESEIIKTIPHPKLDVYLECVPMSKSVSYFRILKDLSMEVWMLKNYESEEWVKLPDFRVEALREEVAKVSNVEAYNYNPYNLLQPKCWLKNDERIIFCSLFRNLYFVFDIKTGSTIATTPKRAIFGTIIPITSTLAWVYDS